MKNLIFILLFAFANTAFAQQDTTLVYNSPMYTKDPVRSKWTPTVKKVSDGYQVTFHNRKNVIQEVITFEDKALTVRKGSYVAYKDGVESEKGSFDKGHKHGEWITYGGEPLGVKKVEQFTHGKLNGKHTDYWDGGQLKQEGIYETGRKIGEWKLYYKDGKLAGNETYDPYGKKGQSAYFFNDGKSAKYEDLFAMPTYQGGITAFYSFLANEIRFPSSAVKNGVSGTVKLSFTVTTKGMVEDIKIVESPDDDLSAEAERVVRRTKWIPGKQYGEIVKVRYYIPIKFTLPR